MAKLIMYGIVVCLSFISVLDSEPRYTFLKPATHLAILYADVPGAAIAIFADRRDWRIKSPISGMSDIGD